MSAEAPVVDERFILDEIGLKWVTWRKGHHFDHPEYGKPIIGTQGEEMQAERLVATRKIEDPTILSACQTCSPGTQNEPLYKPLPPEIKEQIKGISYGFCGPHLEEFLAPIRKARKEKEEAARIAKENIVFG